MYYMNPISISISWLKPIKSPNESLTIPIFLVLFLHFPMLSPWKYGDVLPEKCRLQAQLTQLRRWPRVPDTTRRGEEDPTLGVSIVMEAPQNGWFIRENPNYKWMMTRGIPIYGKPPS